MYLINKPVHLVVLLLLTLLRVMVSLPGILHGAGLWQLPKQLYLPADEKSAQAANSHLKYVWYDPPDPCIVPVGTSVTFLQLGLRSGTCVLAFAFLGFPPGSAVPFLPLTSHFRCLV